MRPAVLRVRRILVPCLCGVLIAACARAPAPATPSSTRTAVSKPATAMRADLPAPAAMARFDGYGPARLGMSVEALRAAWPAALAFPAHPDVCFVVLAHDPGPVRLMFENGVFVRYDLDRDNPREVAPGGGRVGMRIDELRRLYGGRMVESPHKYVEGGKVLRVASGDAEDDALVFEADADARVTTWRVGRPPQVDYVESCG